MSMIDQSNVFFENFVISGAGTTYNSNVIDTQGTANVTTGSTTFGIGAGAPWYLAVYVGATFTTVTSVAVSLRTSDTTSGTYAGGNVALSGTITTLYNTGAVVIANVPTIGKLWIATIVPVIGAKQYLDVLVTVVGPSVSEVGSLTAYLTEAIQGLQNPLYPIPTIA